MLFLFLDKFIHKTMNFSSHFPSRDVVTKCYDHHVYMPEIVYKVRQNDCFSVSLICKLNREAI